MNIDSLIEFSAIAGKIAIEHTQLHPIAKVSINWTIDRVAEYLKKEYLPDIEAIRRDAERFDIDKVIAIPVVYNGTYHVAIRVYGRDSVNFIRRLGLQIIPEKSGSDTLVYINEIEKNFGILIYEKKH